MVTVQVTRLNRLRGIGVAGVPVAGFDSAFMILIPFVLIAVEFLFCRFCG
jgi:hypothetical protein